MAHNCTPIKQLNPSIPIWTIWARIMKKGEKREWKNNRGSGVIFSVTLIDKAGA
jgi:replication factor A1